MPARRLSANVRPETRNWWQQTLNSIHTEANCGDDLLCLDLRLRNTAMAPVCTCKLERQHEHPPRGPQKGVKSRGEHSTWTVVVAAAPAWEPKAPGTCSLREAEDGHARTTPGLMNLKAAATPGKSTRTRPFSATQRRKDAGGAHPNCRLRSSLSIAVGAASAILLRFVLANVVVGACGVGNVRGSGNAVGEASRAT